MRVKRNSWFPIELKNPIPEESLVFGNRDVLNSEIKFFLEIFTPPENMVGCAKKLSSGNYALITCMLRKEKYVIQPDKSFITTSLNHTEKYAPEVYYSQRNEKELEDFWNSDTPSVKGL